MPKPVNLPKPINLQKPINLSKPAYEVRTEKKKQAIISKLVAAGFSYDLVNRAVQSLGVRSENELELLKREYDKAFVRYAKKYEGHDLKQRVLTSLMQKGFDYDEIKELLEEENGKES